MLRVIIAAALLLISIGTPPTMRAAAPRFYPDDPISRDVDSQDASGVQPYEIDLEYDALENMFYTPGDPVANVRAQNLNTIDEVPDSSWYTNRLPLSPDDIIRGGATTNGPAAGPWVVISAKTDGVSPGFTVKDRDGVVWFLKFDPPGHRGMATGAEVLGGRLLWALGYHVPELHIASLRREQLILGADTRVRTLSGRRLMRAADVDHALSRAARDPDGSYRVVASRRIDGKPLGGFRFYGTRPDDPNDYVPHEHRRELRGYGTFAAWLHHVDAKSLNTFDALVTENGISQVRHYLLDFGSTLGSGGTHPRPPYQGVESLVEGRTALKGILSFGFYIAPWRTQPMFESPEAGAFPLVNEGWNPDEWKPHYPNPAFLRARADDKFWAASKLQALTREHVQAAIAAARYGDPQTEAAILRFLTERRFAILSRYLTAINPIVAPTLDVDGALMFANAAVDADVARIPREYHATWSRFDNATDRTTTLGETTNRTPSMQAPAPLPTEPGAFVKVEIRATSDHEASWAEPVHAYFRRESDRWALVGFERMPQGNAPTAFRMTERLAPTAAATGSRQEEREWH